MSAMDQVRYCLWRAELWGRDYGTNRQIDEDVEAGILLPGTMPDACWREGDVWRKQSEVERLLRSGGRGKGGSRDG